jgi:hypothetical protein
MPQTDIQEQSSIRQGSVRVLIGEDFDNLVDIGALRNPVINALAENQSIEFDNTDPLRKFVRGQRFQLTFDLCEINLTSIAALDDGMVNLSAVAAEIVSGAVQLVVDGGWSFEQFIAIAHQNGDKSAIDVNSVTGTTDGLLVVDVDYHIIEANGVYGIVVHNTGSGGVTTEDQNISINYDYTPNASKKLTFNDSGTKTLKCMRIVNTDENDKEFRVDLEEGTNFAPISIDFATDEEADVAVLPIDFQGKVVEFVDEQNA